MPNARHPRLGLLVPAARAAQWVDTAAGRPVRPEQPCRHDADLSELLVLFWRLGCRAQPPVRMHLWLSRTCDGIHPDAAAFHHRCRRPKDLDREIERRLRPVLLGVVTL